jgi:hypothetical protein
LRGGIIDVGDVGIVGVVGVVGVVDVVDVVDVVGDDDDVLLERSSPYRLVRGYFVCTVQ